ncbi:MAG: ABC transporter substrate-binding protein [Deltaproteobacteria bacterium]|nr:ABC transporter substrate-binding protein [Deltaproteobacteria bacterium]MDZ4343500.1 ABC transporter substrate-binding protein [Candidatus Binatia bacterium]
MKKYIGYLLLLCQIVFLMPAWLAAQAKPIREITVSYPIGGSTSYFWVAHKSGSFEKHGLRLRAVHISGSVAAIQSLLARELFIQFEGGPAGVRAWARGAKDVTVIGAVGNKLDYLLVSIPSIKKPEDLKGKRIGVSAIGASSDFIARHAVRQLGLNPEKDVSILASGAMGLRWAAISGGNLDATVVQPPFTLLARKAGMTVHIDLSKQEFQYPISAVLTTRSFIKTENETVMNFMRGLADGMDFYRDQANKEKVYQYLGEYYRSKARDELEETRRVYSQMTPGLPVISAKSIENLIVNDKELAPMGLKPSEILDLSFLDRLQEERKSRGR